MTSTEAGTSDQAAASTPPPPPSSSQTAAEKKVSADRRKQGKRYLCIILHIKIALKNFDYNKYTFDLIIFISLS